METQGQLGLKHVGMSVSKSEENVFFFQHQVNVMNEKLSFKMGVKYAASLYMGKDLLDIYISKCRDCTTINRKIVLRIHSIWVCLSNLM